MWVMPRRGWLWFATACMLLVAAGAATTYPGTYAETMRYVFIHEGGYANHPRDPGGPTNFGITIHDVRRYINPRATAADVRRITREQAAEIYRVRYWNAVRGDELPPGLDYTVMDLAVNSGVGRARQFLREHLEGADIHMGPLTDAEIALVREECIPDHCQQLIRRINDRRSRFVHALCTCTTFCRAWDRRIIHVRRQSLVMAGASAEAGGGFVSPYRPFWEQNGRAIERPSDLEREDGEH